jgi:DNA-directed RNA polymerase subunit M/transcription elongation factor TFIIS
MDYEMNYETCDNCGNFLFSNNEKSSRKIPGKIIVIYECPVCRRETKKKYKIIDY